MPRRHGSIPKRPIYVLYVQNGPRQGPKRPAAACKMAHGLKQPTNQVKAETKVETYMGLLNCGQFWTSTWAILDLVISHTHTSLSVCTMLLCWRCRHWQKKMNDWSRSTIWWPWTKDTGRTMCATRTKHWATNRLMRTSDDEWETRTRWPTY